MNSPNPPPKRESRMRLTNVVKGRLVKPPRILVHGPEGIGKSTLAAGAPSPIFVAGEDGTSELDVTRFPEPHTWTDVLDAVNELITAPHIYETLALDTVNWIEPKCWDHVCQKHGFKTIEAPGYGKGYLAALDEWRVLLARLEDLRATRGMTIILLAHTAVRNFKNPEGEDFGRYMPKLDRGAASLLMEWCDIVLHAKHEQYTHELNGRARGISTGQRVLCTQRTAAFDAKNRHDLPDQLPLDWASFAAALAQRPAAIQAELDAELARASDDVKARVRKALETAGDDITKRKQILIHLAALNNQKPKETAQ